MGNKKLKATRQVQRVAALQYNPYFREAVRRIRNKYGIPKDRDRARVWFNKLVKHYEKSTLALYFKSTWDCEPFPLDWGVFAFGDRYWMSLYKSKKLANEMETLLDTEVPLEKAIIGVLASFGLPMMVYFKVLQYVLTEEDHYLDTLDLINGPLKCVCLYSERIGALELIIRVVGVSSWTSEKQWNSLWHQEVEGKLKKLRRMEGAAVPSRKRSTVFSYWSQMRIWAEWYQLAEVEGLGPAKALNKWEDNHPNQRGKFDLSTVTHAIVEFREIITPIPIKD